MPKSTNPLLRRTSSSPFSGFPRKKPISRKSSLAEKEESSERLQDTGLTPSLAPKGVPQDVLSLINYAKAHRWEEIPDRAAGMNSVKISEILRFRAALPPIISISHLHAISVSITQTERELARLVAQGVVRKLTIPGRGKGGAPIGDGVVLVEDWKTRVRAESSIDGDLQEKYIALLTAHSTSPTTPTTSLTSDEIRQLITVGFLTSPSSLSLEPTNSTATPGMASQINIATAGSTAASGTLAAVGGVGSILSSGGGGNALNRTPSQHQRDHQMTFALPTTGAYLKLLTTSRLHLLALLKSLSPRHKEATLSLLREKWAGNVLDADDEASQAKRARGEWRGVLAGRTKMWREFWGMEFEWILAEGVGGGLVEVFETGSVGWGVRGR